MSSKIPIVLICVGLFSLAHAERRPKTPVPAANEPFHTFALLDSKLSTLNKQQDELRRSILPEGSKATSTIPKSKVRPWTLAARAAQQTARSMNALARKQEVRYRNLKQAFGVRAFEALAREADAVADIAGVLGSTLDDSEAAKQKAVFEQRTLALVLQYQAITGGYGAVHCSSGERPCCEPKENGNAAVGCKWVCVASAGKCGNGFTGPRTSSAGK